MKKSMAFLLALHSSIAFSVDLKNPDSADVAKLTFNDSLPFSEIQAANNFCREAYDIDARLIKIVTDLQLINRFIILMPPDKLQHYTAIDDETHRAVLEEIIHIKHLSAPVTSSADTNKAMADILNDLVTASESADKEAKNSRNIFVHSRPSEDEVNKEEHYLDIVKLQMALGHATDQSRLISSYKLQPLYQYHSVFSKCIPLSSMEVYKDLFIAEEKRKNK